jgi:hypothetical protein
VVSIVVGRQIRCPQPLGTCDPASPHERRDVVLVRIFIVSCRRPQLVFGNLAQLLDHFRVPYALDEISVGELRVLDPTHANLQLCDIAR